MRCVKPSALVLLPAIALGALCGGCSADLYMDRREGVTFYGGDATASNVAVQTIDPWSKAAGNRRAEVNGERMQRAAERYRTNKTYPLQAIGTSSVPYNQVGASGGGGGGGGGGGAAGATP